MTSTINQIKRLKKLRLFFNSLRYIPVFPVIRDYCDNKILSLAHTVLDDIAIKSGIQKKYSNVDITNLPQIGTTVWMFWYTGFNTAPPLVQKCAEIATKLFESNVILIDKNNLEKYFVFEGNIRELFEKGKISIQTFSDILRCQLLSKYGGFWVDATVFIPHQDFILKNKDRSFFSIKHSSNDILFKQKWNEFFNKGLWSTYCNGACIQNPIFAFIYDMFVSYYNSYDEIFDYFEIDYIWLYCYETFEWARKLINEVPYTVNRVFYFHKHLLKKFNQKEWDDTIQNNLIQKLGWRAVSGNKLKKKRNYETYYDHFLKFTF